MKKLIISTLAMSLMMLVYLSSCVKSETDLIEVSKSEQIHSPVNEGSDNVSGRASDTGVEIECNGTCSNSKECYAVLRPTGGGTWECTPCTECKMKLIYRNGIGDDYEYKMDLIKIDQAFADRLNEFHDGATASITRIVMDHSEDMEFIKYEYFLGDNKNETYSVAYTTTFSEFGKGPIFEVDCTGTCENPICTEVFNPGKGEVYCKCESDSCKMTVQQVDN